MVFQSSFELTGYITTNMSVVFVKLSTVSKLFRAYGLYNKLRWSDVQYNGMGFKALSSLRVI